MKKRFVQRYPLLTPSLLLLAMLGLFFNTGRGAALEKVSQPKSIHPHLSARQLAAPRVWKTHAGEEASDLRWSPDGRWAVYRLRECLDHVPANGDDLDHYSLCSIRADGTGARRLYSAGKDVEIAGWSPDGQRVLFWERVPHSGSLNADGSPLYDVSVPGGKLRLLTRPFQSTDGDMDDWMMREPGTLAFSPDGKSLLLVVGGGRNSCHNKRLELLSYPSGRLKWRTRSAIAVSEPVWAPDGRHIAFVANPDPGPIQPENAYTSLSYTSLWREAHSHLWLIDAEGRHRRQLTTDAHYYESGPKWVQGSAVIRFTRNKNPMDDNDNGSEWEVHTDGSGLQRARRSKREPRRKSQESFDTARLNAMGR